jgi:hypothetical protein
MMAYKSVVARLMPRAAMMRRLKQKQNQTQNSVVVIPTGELIHSIGEEDLLNN